MRDRRDAIILALLAISLAGLAFVLRPLARDYGEQVHLSSYRSGPYGARAAYLLLEELGLPVERGLSPWVEHAEPGGLVLLLPSEAPTPREVDALVAWVRAGNTLIYGVEPMFLGPAAAILGSRPDSLMRAFGLRLQPLVPPDLNPLAADRWPGLAAYPSRHEWTAGIDSVPGFRFGFSPRSPALNAGGAEVLLRTGAGSATVVLLEVGAGRVIAWSDPTVLANRELREGGAALLFARAAAAAAETGPVLFDEYHQGYRADGGPFMALRRFLTGTGVGRVLLQAAVAALLLLVLAGHRFGAPVFEPEGRRRSPLEHVDAVAAAYGRAGARATARRLLLLGLDRRTGRRVSPEAASEVVALGGGAAARRLESLLRDGAEVGLVALAAAIDDYIVETRGWK